MTFNGNLARNGDQHLADFVDHRQKTVFDIVRTGTESPTLLNPDDNFLTHGFDFDLPLSNFRFQLAGHLHCLSFSVLIFQLRSRDYNLPGFLALVALTFFLLGNFVLAQNFQ